MKFLFAILMSFFAVSPAFALGEWCRVQPLNQQENCYAVTARTWNASRTTLYKKIFKYRPDLKDQLWQKEQAFQQQVDSVCQSNKCVANSLEQSLLDLRVLVRGLGLEGKQ